MEFLLAGASSACMSRADPSLEVNLVGSTNLDPAACAALCPPGTQNPDGSVSSAIGAACYVYDMQDAGWLDCTYTNCCHAGGGRRPAGLIKPPTGALATTAQFLAEMAHLEAASVVAFERLARELQTHGAPRRLVTAARRSALDEVRHARVTKRLAEQRGATVPTCAVNPVLMRSLEEMAVENVVEGCVRETFGAALALFQAKSAKYAEIRRAVARIARDECRHAQLSWAVAAWLDSKLDPSARRRVSNAHVEAVGALRREMQFEPSAEGLGLPSAVQANVMLEALSDGLWNAAYAA
jgi:hypothetical protein